LAEYLQPIQGTGFSDEELQRQNEELERTRQQIIAQCMRDAGFDYQPIEVPEQPIRMNQPSDRDWVMQNGIGLTGDMLESFVQEASVADPNEEFVNQLSVSERRAWNEALWGPPLEGDISDLGDGGGCQGYSWRQITDGDPRFEFEALFDAIAEMRDNIDNSNAMTLVNADYANCMADNGFPEFSSPNNVLSSLLTAAVTDYVEDFRSIATSRVAGTVEDPLAAEWIAEFRTHEVDLALADFDCKEAVDWESRREIVVNEIESQFVQDYRSQLEALRAAIEQRG